MKAVRPIPHVLMNMVTQTEKILGKNYLTPYIAVTLGIVAWEVASEDC